MLVDQQWTWRENQALARRLHAAKLKGARVEEIDYRASRGLDKSVFRVLAIARADGSLRSLLTRLNRIDMRAESMRKGRPTKPTD
jgi:hypothetical protein